MHKAGRVLLACAAGWVLDVSGAPLTIPAPAFSDLGSAAVVGDHLVLRESTEVKAGIRVPFQGDHHLVVTARGKEAIGELARASVSVDGVRIGVLDAVSGADWRTHTFPVNLAEGERLISIRFLNDYFDAEEGEDRNFYLHSITLIQNEEVPGLEPINQQAFQTGQEQRRAQVLEEADQTAWRIRQGAVVVQVLDSEGAPVDRAAVTLETVNPAFKLGTALASKVFDPDRSFIGHMTYKALVEQNFNEVVPEAAMKWPSMERLEGQVDSKVLDAMIRWALERDMSIRGHCMFWACPERVPGWVKGLDNDRLMLRIEQRIKQLIEAYPEVKEYDVNNEMLRCSFYQDRLGPEIRSRMFTLSHQASKDARLYVNEFNILNGLKSNEYMEQIQDLLADRIPVGGIGVQAHFKDEVDVTSVRQVLDQLAIFKLPIKLTELDIQVEDEELQAQYLEDIMRVAYGHPAVVGIVLWGFWEAAHWRPEAALYRTDFSPKPAGLVLERLARAWKAAYIKDTGPEGLVDDYLPYGKCRVSVQAQGFQKQTIPFEHVPSRDGDPKRITVVLKKP